MKNIAIMLARSLSALFSDLFSSVVSLVANNWLDVEGSPQRQVFDSSNPIQPFCSRDDVASTWRHAAPVEHGQGIELF